MILLDAYALIALLREGPAADQVETLIRRGDTAIPTANLVELRDVCERVHALPGTEVQQKLDPLVTDRVRTIALDRKIAWCAGALRARHYHGRRQALSLADCVLLASAAPGDQIATADPAVLAVAEAEGISCVALPGEG